MTAKTKFKLRAICNEIPPATSTVPVVLSEKPRTIKIPNPVNNAFFSNYTCTSLRIMLGIIPILQKTRDPYPLLSLSYSDCAELLGWENASCLYDEKRRIAFLDNLQEVRLLETNQKGRRVGYTVLFPRVTCNEKERTIQIRLTPEFVSDVRSDNYYSLLCLEDVSNLKSKYAIRLYLMLIKFRNIPKNPKTGIREVDFTLEQLRLYFDIKKRSSYWEFHKLNSKILQPAIKAINKNKKGLAYVSMVKTKDSETGEAFIRFSFKIETHKNALLNKKRIKLGRKE